MWAAAVCHQEWEEIEVEEGELLDGIDTDALSERELTSLQAAVPKYPVLAEEIGTSFLATASLGDGGVVNVQNDATDWTFVHLDVAIFHSSSGVVVGVI
jgi:hypothetical protein